MRARITNCCWAVIVLGHSAGRQMLEVVTMNTSFSNHSFAAAAPHVWNGLPDAVRYSSVFEDDFAKLSKTYLMNYVQAVASLTSDWCY